MDSPLLLRRVFTVDNLNDLPLNWLLLVIAVVIVICVLFFLFYWNRLVARCLSFLLRLRYWKSTNTWIECESFQISLLSGRVFLKDVRYYSRNQSVRILKCHVTWRYWIWRTQDDVEEPRQAGGVGEDIQGRTRRLQLPCRIFVYMEGVEWFLYNRTPAYDAIVTRLQEAAAAQSGPKHELSFPFGPPQDAASPPVSPTRANSEKPPFSAANQSHPNLAAPSAHATSTRTRAPTLAQTFMSRSAAPLLWLRGHLPAISFNDLLPVDLHVLTGAVTMGNDSTPYLVIGSFKSGRGMWGVGEARSACDRGRQVLDARLFNVRVVSRTNPDYQADLVTAGLETYSDALRDSSIGAGPLHTPSSLLLPSFAHIFSPLLKRKRTRQDPPISQSSAPIKVWKGLDRFRTEEERTRGEMRHEQEYAKVPGLLEAKEIQVGWYADVPGMVPEEPVLRVPGRAGPEERDEIGNGDTAPEWGVDLLIRDGTVAYGPWMDRQRAFLQAVFSPTSWADNRPTLRLKPGDARMATSMKVFIQLEGATTLRLPTRETSKDWKYDNVPGFGPSGADADERPYGWLNIKCGRTSTVSYVLPAVVGPQGYDTTLDVDLADVGITSSVNYANFWQSERVHVGCVMPSPLKWNAERDWTFDVEFQRSKVFLLRDHIYLIQDLVKDWNSGPQQEYAVFLPTRYQLDMKLRDYELNLYANDFNVVSKPLSRDDNVFVTITGPLLAVSLPIDSTRWKPQCSEVPFAVDVPDAHFSMTFPLWNTHGAFATPRTAHFGTSPVFKISGSYLYYAGVHRDFVDRLKLNVTAEKTVFKCFGWVIRHVMILRENYFGTFTNFTTLEEYQQKRTRGELGDPVEAKWRPGKSNPFDVDVRVNVQDGLVLLPQEIHELTAAVAIDVPEFDVSIGVHEFFMDLQILVPPVRLIAVTNPEDWVTNRPPIDRADAVVVEGMNIVCNRYFGPQPRTSTYLCLWEMSYGAIRGCVPLSFATSLSAAAQAIAHTFSDVVNSPDPSLEADENADVTFLKVAMAPVDLIFQCGKSALQLRLLDGLLLDYTDLPRPSYSRAVSIIAAFSVRALIPSDAHSDIWYETASVIAGAKGEFYLAPENWRRKAETQTGFVMDQDASTHRALFVYAPDQEGRTFEAWRRHGVFFLTYPRSLDEAGGAWANARASYDYALSSSEGSSNSSKEFVSMGGRTPGRVHAALPTPTATYFDAQDVMERDETSTDDSDDEDSDSASGAESDHTGSSRRLRNNWPTGEAGPHSILKPFRMKREQTSFITTLVPVEHWGSFPPLLPRNHWSKEQLLQSHDSIHRDAANTTILLDICDPVQVFLTPHATQFVDDLYSTANIAVCSADREMDILMLDQMARSTPPKKATSTVLSLQLHSIAVRTLQLGAVPNERDPRPKRERKARQEHYGAMHHVLTICDLSIGQSALLVAFNIESRGTECSAKLASPRVCLWRSTANDWGKSAVDPASLLSRMSFAVEFSQVVEIAAEAMQIAAGLAPTGATCDVGLLPVNVRFVDVGAETAVAAAVELAHGLRQVTSLQHHAVLRSQSRARFLLWTVLTSAEDRKFTTDPPFLNLTTFLVQHGRPGQRRSDNGWRIVAHARHCLRLLPATMCDHLNRSLNSEITLSDFGTEVAMYTEVMAILQKWRTWEIDTGSPSVQGLLRALFPASVPSQGPPVQPTAVQGLVLSNFVRLTVEELNIALVDAGLPDDTLVALGTFSLTCLTRSQSISLSAAKTSDDQENAASLSRNSAWRAYLDANMANIDIHLSPDLMTVLQRMLRLRRMFPQKTMTSRSISPATGRSIWRLPDGFRLAIIDITTSIKLVNIHAAAQKITFDFIVRQLISASTIRLDGSLIDFNDMAISSTSTITNDDLVFRARSPNASHRAVGNHRSMAWLSLAKPSISIGMNKPRDNVDVSCHSALAFKRIGISVPHSAIRLYKFVEEWRAEYIPTYDSMIRGILAELEPVDIAETPKSGTPWVDWSRFTLYTQAAVETIAINLRVLPSTWFSWEYHGIFASAQTAKGFMLPSDPSAGLHYSLRLESQTIRLVQATASFNEGLPTTAPLITLELPAFDFSGSFSQSIIQSLAIVDYFSIKLNAQVMDDLLVIPSKFGKDVNEILDVISDSRRKQSRRERSPTSPTKKDSTDKRALLYSVRIMMRGFQTGIEGPSSTQFVEAAKLEGNITNRTLKGLQWNVSVTGLMLSLAHTALTTTQHGSRKSRYRSAYMSVDLEASNTPPKGAFGKSEPGTDSLAISVHRIHAVMQAAAIGELGDLLDHYQGEMLLRKDQRAEEIETIKAQTQKVLQTFEPQDRVQAVQQAPSWFGTRFIHVSVSQIGVSFPLTLDEIGVPSVDSEGSGPLPVSPAFLFSIVSVMFMSEPNNTGSAGLKELSFQFVPRFDQSDDAHFTARGHNTRNNVFFPDMKVDIRTMISTRARRIRLLASMTGFNLDLDPTIVPYVFSLIDVYDKGKERLQRLAQPVRSPDSPVFSKTEVLLPKPKRASTAGPSPAADIKASFEFKTARVRLFPPSDSDNATAPSKAKRVATLRRNGLGINGLPRFPSETLEAETFNLPGLSAWCEYAGPMLLPNEEPSETQPALLLLSAVVHPSRNTLKPSLLPFISELARNIERRMQRLAVPSTSPAVPVPPPLIPRGTSAVGVEALTSSGIASMQINFSLRIDQSTLEMTCQPHVNVAAAVTWESGGFLVTVSPGAREISFAASIAGISGVLRHGYLSENCLHVSAQDLAVSAAFRPVRGSDGTSANVISLVVDTQISGGVRFSRLQDLLCFKAVWLDSIPIIEPSRGPDTPEDKPIALAPSSRPLITCLLVQIRSLQLEADLGQSITRLDLSVDTLTFRSRLAPDTSEVSLNITTINLKADRTLSGYAHVDGLAFETSLRQKAFAGNQREPRMLDLRIQLGETEVGLSTDSKKILQFHSNPVHVQVNDDWSLMLNEHEVEQIAQEVQLNFFVRTEALEAVGTILTLPRLIALYNRLQVLLATQREGAARESETFRALRSARVDNPLSEVATAMIQSARSKFREAGEARTVVILQNMTLEAGHIRLAVFPRSTADQDMVRFEARTVSAELTRNALDDGRYHRNLNMHLSSFGIQRLQPRALSPDDFENITAVRWFALLKSASEVTIFNGPPTRVYMESWEDPRLMHLDYEFDMTYSSLFDKSAEGSVFLALNYALLKWLGALGQSFQEEMDKVLLKGSGDVTDMPVSPTSPLRNEVQSSGTPTAVLVPSTNETSRPTTPTAETSSPTSAPDSTPLAATPRKMTYRKLTPGSIELPQLTQLGDITPRSNQLTLVGLRLDAIPKWVHEGATLSLEIIMKGLLQLYSRQLRRIKAEK